MLVGIDIKVKGKRDPSGKRGIENIMTIVTYSTLNYSVPVPLFFYFFLS